METISSPNNPKVRLVRSLRQRKIRDRERLYLVEGIHHVGAALEAGAEIAYLYYAPDQLTSSFGSGLVSLADGQGVPTYPVTPQVFAGMADRENPQGILAVVRQRWGRLEELDPTRFPWGVVLVNPQDPGNLGAVLRTVDAVGASGLIQVDGGVDPFHPTAVRASMGALFWRPIAAATFARFADWARQHAYQLTGTSAHGEQDYRDADYTLPALLMMGSEREGLSQEQRAICTREVRLPMEGHVSSLNLAVATGVLLYAMKARYEADLP